VHWPHLYVSRKCLRRASCFVYVAQPPLRPRSIDLRPPIGAPPSPTPLPPQRSWTSCPPTGSGQPPATATPAPYRDQRPSRRRPPPAPRVRPPQRHTFQSHSPRWLPSHSPIKVLGCFFMCRSLPPPRSPPSPPLFPPSPPTSPPPPLPLPLPAPAPASPPESEPASAVREDPVTSCHLKSKAPEGFLYSNFKMWPKQFVSFMQCL